jgi:hypothetical protein
MAGEGHMNKLDTSRASPRQEVRVAVYYVSDRPEAYETWAEVSHEEAERIGRTIAWHAQRDFPEFDFRVDHDWHLHQKGMEHVAAHIDSHLQAWIDEALGR